MYIIFVLHFAKAPVYSTLYMYMQVYIHVHDLIHTVGDK